MLDFFLATENFAVDSRYWTSTTGKTCRVPKTPQKPTQVAKRTCCSGGSNTARMVRCEKTGHATALALTLVMNRDKAQSPTRAAARASVRASEGTCRRKHICRNSAALRAPHRLA